MKELQEFITRQITPSGFWLLIYAKWINAYMFIENTLYPTPLIQAVISNSKPERLDELLGNVISELGLESDSGHVHRETRCFIAWAIQNIHERRLASIGAEKRQRLDSLRKEQLRIEAELRQLMEKPADANN